MKANILNTVVEHRSLFVPSLFTNRQVGIIGKYLNKEALNSTERTYLYSAIKRKVDALRTLQKEFYITGEGMLPERVEEAKKILEGMNEDRAFVSGSFLYKRDYADIDIYVLANKRKSYSKGNHHLTFITEKNLKNPLFLSSLQSSVATFSIAGIQPEIKRPSFNEIIMAYEMAINEILDNDDQKMVRDVLFSYYLHVKGTVLSSVSLYKEFAAMKKKRAKEKIATINGMMRELLLTLYSKKYLYAVMGPLLKNLRRTVKEYKTHDNVLIYLDLFSEVKRDCRRA